MTKNYKDTLNLPKTDFPMKANLAVREPEQLKKWDEAKIYRGMIDKNSEEKKFILHDGPPYANGGLHLGTILNKVLKDIVVKYKNMSGVRCEYIPGWDCHGLPIELAVDKKLGSKKRELDPIDIRLACREYANKFVGIQREEFKRLGCLARWEKPYLTMSHEYEASIAREFGKFVERGSLYKGKKPIYWCAKCRTALAEAEVEYADHESPSIFVKFKLKDDEKFRKDWGLVDEPISLVIWTTTPWTIPANLAIALNPNLPYVAAKVGGEVWIMAEGLIDSVMEAVGKSYSTIVGKPAASDLENCKCQHPLIDRESLVILGDHVTLEAGTGAVHTAPGHGQDDYVVGQKYGLDVLAPVDNGGKFTEEVGLDWLVGLYIEKANAPILEKLEEVGALVKSEKITHSYPHCWRCKRPIVFRSTDQWFVSMIENDLRKKALLAIDGVQWIPPWGQNRITGMIENRPDWCISRQRLWGVPIIALICDSCGTPHTTPELVSRAVALFEEEGADAWYTHPMEDFKPDGFKCPSCNEDKNFTKERDILDVWFDSGVSYAAVLERGEGIEEQADLYLEGSDQHRGWFHTSLLTSIATHDRAPYKRVLTHGFVVDGKGKKYSKSAKNYVPPEKLINQHGAETLRYWVASEDYREDIRFSDEIFKRCIEAYRKLRNTARFILGNISDFDPSKDAVAEENMEDIDRWAIAQMGLLIDRVNGAYDNYETHVILHSINRFCSVEMSSFYLDVLKDRLYTEAGDSALRRSAQTAMWKILDSLVRLLAPVLSFTSDEIWGFMPKLSDAPECVLLSDMPKHRDIDGGVLKRWEKLILVRPVIMKALENARADKFIGNSLAASITIECDDNLQKYLESFDGSLADLFIVSSVQFGKISGEYVNKGEGINVSVEKSSGGKCERCWKYTAGDASDPDRPMICERCSSVTSVEG